MSQQDPIPDPTEQAIADRLARLRTRPVDLSSLKKRIELQIPRPQIQPAPSRLRLWAARPLRAVAALLALALTLGVILVATWSGPALASTDDFVRLHTSLVAHQAAMTDVSSMEAANAALAGKWPDAPHLPDVPDEAIMSCCVHHIGKAKAACALLTIEGVPVTLAAAEASEMKMPAMPQIQHGGTTFSVKSAQELNMAMTQHNGKWYCLMGKLPAERLMDFWNSLSK